MDKKTGQYSPAVICGGIIYPFLLFLSLGLGNTSLGSLRSPFNVLAILTASYALSRPPVLLSSLNFVFSSVPGILTSISGAVADFSIAYFIPLTC